MKSKILFLCIMLLTSCNKNHEVKIPLFHISINETTFLKIDETSLNNMKDKNISFPLYIYQENCGTCDIFYTVMKEYIKEENICFPFIYLDEYKEIENYSPSQSMIVIYRNGVISSSFKTEDKVSTLKEMRELMSKYFVDYKKKIKNKTISINENLYNLDLNFYLDEIKEKCLFINEKTFTNYDKLSDYDIENVYFSSSYFIENKIEESISEFDNF